VTAVLPQPRTASALERVPSPRRYLMCRPEHFAVSYAINPWMDVALGVDRELAVRQWETLRQTYLDLGHDVQVIAPEPGLPDMVFAANGGLVIEGRALGARFTHAERRAEGPAYLAWLAVGAWRSARRVGDAPAKAQSKAMTDSRKRALSVERPLNQSINLAQDAEPAPPANPNQCHGWIPVSGHVDHGRP